jgi:LmbE family N-acetylglucosaminyl deacetylase
MNERTMLVVLAHPDDESFAIGGTLAKYAAEGARITLICATRGEAGIPWTSPPATATIRERELRAAAAILGIAEVRFLDELDGMLFKADHTRITERLTTAMRELHPQVVITFGPDGISGHFDHLVMHHATTAAFDEAGLDDAQLFYIAPSEATRQGCGVILATDVASEPVTAIDIGAHLVTKVRAIQCHASQQPPFAGPPEEAAKGLVCHEYFTLARPIDAPAELTDLFASLPEMLAAHM